MLDTRLPTRRLVSIFLLALAVVILARDPVHAESGPINLSGWIDERMSPWISLIAADAEGNLHVVWNGWAGSEQPETTVRNAIFYTWWNGESWSPPVDVLLSSTGTGVVPGSLLTTKDGEIILTWNDSNRILLSRVRIGNAMSAGNWQTTSLDEGYNPRLAVDRDNSQWSLTWDDKTNVMLATSADSWTWTSPLLVWSAPHDGSAPQNESVGIADDGSVHLAWSEHTERRDWNGEAIWYARTNPVDGGTLQVREVARNEPGNGPSLDSPALAIGSNGQVHLFWNNGVGSSTGRYYQWSDDYGSVWSPVGNAFPELSGQTGPAGMVFDSGGGLRLITAAGLNYLASWQNESWSAANVLWPETYSERPALTITNGNQLHVVWNACQDCTDNIKRQWSTMYAAYQVDAPAVSPEGFVAQVTVGNQQAPTPQSTPSLLPPESSASSPPPAPPSNDSSADVRRPSSGIGLLVLGVLPAALLVLVVAAVRLRTTSRHG